MDAESASAVAEAVLIQGDLTLKIGGAWHLNERKPDWNMLVRGLRIKRVRVLPQNLLDWDSALLLFLVRARAWCSERQVPFDVEALPGGLQKLLTQTPVHPAAAEAVPRRTLKQRLYSDFKRGGARFNQALYITGETALSLAHFVCHPRQLRWHETVRQMELCGVFGLPVVGLMAFLIGVILAFQGAAQLRQMGADIFVVDLVTVSIAREMAPMITAIVMAGRTGALYAATLANMKAGEELDALRTLGISPVDFLVTPRLLALTSMMPLLVLYAVLLGVLGGLTVASSTLDISAASFLARTQAVMDFHQISVGLIKSVVFGLLISFVGCLRGLQAEPTSDGAGAAAISATGTSIVLVVCADALFGRFFQMLNF